MIIPLLFPYDNSDWYKVSLLEPIVPPVVEPVVAPVKPRVIKRKRVEEVEEMPTKRAGRPKKE